MVNSDTLVSGPACTKACPSQVWPVWRFALMRPSSFVSTPSPCQLPPVQSIPDSTPASDPQAEMHISRIAQYTEQKNGRVGGAMMHFGRPFRRQCLICRSNSLLFVDRIRVINCVAEVMTFIIIASTISTFALLTHL